MSFSNRNASRLRLRPRLPSLPSTHSEAYLALVAVLAGIGAALLNIIASGILVLAIGVRVIGLGLQVILCVAVLPIVALIALVGGVYHFAKYARGK